MEEQKHRQRNWYNRNYKWLLLIPAIFLIFSIFYLVNFYQKEGDIVYKDVTLTGGTTITVFDSKINPDDLKSHLKSQFPDVILLEISDVQTGKPRGVIIETKAEPGTVKYFLENYLGYKLTNENSSTEFSGASISQGFYQQLRVAIIISFLLMALVVFLIFRTPIRCLSVITSVFADIVMTVVVLDIMKIQLSTAGIVALLMLIGYSVDVDILLTSRVVRSKEGTLNERIFGAFKTGITMTLTVIAATGMALIFMHSVSPVLSQMFTIILIGLGFDIFNCWITNASILKWYMEAKEIA